MTEENELIRAAYKMAVEAGKMGVTLEEAARNLKIFIENIPPLSAYDLELINQNPSLSTIDKLILKRKIKKYIKK